MGEDMNHKNSTLIINVAFFLREKNASNICKKQRDYFYNIKEMKTKEMIKIMITNVGSRR